MHPKSGAHSSEARRLELPLAPVRRRRSWTIHRRPHHQSHDRHLPRPFRWLMRKERVEPFLLTHEIVEKALLDELRPHYLHAHQIAVVRSAMP